MGRCNYASGVHDIRRAGDNGVERINEVALRRARLVLGWVTIFGQANHLGIQPATQANSASYPMLDGK